MLARIRKSMEQKDQGFTLIELLVVMIIIGILAAIAIPVFLNQRKKAVDSAMKSDLRTVANQMESYYTDAQKYPDNVSGTTPSFTLGVGATDTNAVTVTVSKGNVVELVTNNTAGTYCIDIKRASGASPASHTYWQYKSDAGGLQDTDAACVAPTP